jgi:hypothetical protein
VTGAPAQAVGQRDRAEQQAERGRQRPDVGQRRPGQVERAEQLAEEDEGEQREGLRQRVLARRPALDEHRQAGAAEAALVGVELLHRVGCNPARRTAPLN